MYFRLYRINPEDIKNKYMGYRNKAYGSSYDRFDGWSYVFALSWYHSDFGKNLLKSYLSGRSPDKEWSVKTEEKGNYEHLTKIVDPPPLETGIYLVFACQDKSFKIGSSLLSACFLNVTDLVLVGTAGFTTKAENAYYDFIETEGPGTINDEGFRFYAINAKTGKPVDKANLDVFTNFSRRSKRELFNLETDKKGLASFSLPVRVSPRTSNQYYVDPLARKENSFSYWNRNQYLGYYPPSPIVLFIETDRPIYRPGHKVQAKVVAVWRTAEGFRTLGNKQSVTFSALDPNNKKFFTEKVELSEFGSASVSFEIPLGRLLGRYSLSVRCSKERFNNFVWLKQINIIIDTSKY